MGFTYTKHGLIMLFKLPIMLLSNTQKLSLLCPNYAPLWPIMLDKMTMSCSTVPLLKHAYMGIAMYLVFLKCTANREQYAHYIHLCTS